MTVRRTPGASLARGAALLVTAAALAATSAPDCRESESAAFRAETTCGPPGEVRLSFTDGWGDGCGGREDCRAFLEAPGANALGLPEQGEVDTSPRDGSLEDGKFALVGRAPVAGAEPPRTVERTCRVEPAGAGVLRVACIGLDVEAACDGALTRVPEPAP